MFVNGSVAAACHARAAAEGVQVAVVESVGLMLVVSWIVIAGGEVAHGTGIVMAHWTMAEPNVVGAGSSDG